MNLARNLAAVLLAVSFAGPALAQSAPWGVGGIESEELPAPQTAPVPEAMPQFKVDPQMEASMRAMSGQMEGMMRQMMPQMMGMAAQMMKMSSTMIAQNGPAMTQAMTSAMDMAKRELGRADFGAIGKQMEDAAREMERQSKEMKR
jgi:hypothetical protein